VLALLSTAVAGSGLVAGWLVYGRGTVSTETLKRRAGYLYNALQQKLYFDLIYENLIVYPYMRLAKAMDRFDAQVIDGAVNGAASLWGSVSQMGEWFDQHVVDGAVNGVAALVQAAGDRVRRLQVGRVQTYQRAMLAALIVLMLVTVLRGV
jgi:NADH-quinone oxidoreductase subunit L